MKFRDASWASHSAKINVILPWQNRISFDRMGGARGRIPLTLTEREAQRAESRSLLQNENFSKHHHESPRITTYRASAPGFGGGPAAALHVEHSYPRWLRGTGPPAGAPGVGGRALCGTAPSICFPEPGAWGKPVDGRTSGAAEHVTACAGRRPAARHRRPLLCIGMFMCYTKKTYTMYTVYARFSSGA